MKRHDAANTEDNLNDASNVGSEGVSAAGNDGEETIAKVALHKAWSAYLMNIRYAAIMTRPGLLRPTTRLASETTKVESIQRPRQTPFWLVMRGALFTIFKMGPSRTGLLTSFRLWPIPMLMLRDALNHGGLPLADMCA